MDPTVQPRDADALSKLFSDLGEDSQRPAAADGVQPAEADALSMLFSEAAKQDSQPPPAAAAAGAPLLADFQGAPAAPPQDSDRLMEPPPLPAVPKAPAVQPAGPSSPPAVQFPPPPPPQALGTQPAGPSPPPAVPFPLPPQALGAQPPGPSPPPAVPFPLPPQAPGVQPAATSSPPAVPLPLPPQALGAQPAGTSSSPAVPLPLPPQALGVPPAGPSSSPAVPFPLPPQPTGQSAPPAAFPLPPQAPGVQPAGPSAPPTSPFPPPEASAVEPTGPSAPPSNPFLPPQAPAVQPAGPSAPSTDPFSPPQASAIEPTGPSAPPSDPFPPPQAPAVQPAAPSAPPTNPFSPPQASTVQPTGPSAPPTNPFPPPQASAVQPAVPSAPPTNPFSTTFSPPQASAAQPTGPSLPLAAPFPPPQAPAAQPTGPSPPPTAPFPPPPPQGMAVQPTGPSPPPAVQFPLNFPPPPPQVQPASAGAVSSLFGEPGDSQRPATADGAEANALSMLFSEAAKQDTQRPEAAHGAPLLADFQAAGQPPLPPLPPGPPPSSAQPATTTLPPLPPSPPPSSTQPAVAVTGRTRVRPQCSVAMFGFGGQFLKVRAGSEEAPQVRSIQEPLRNHLQTWLQDLEAFPGPLGRADPGTTQTVIRYLRDIAARFTEQGGACASVTLLASAVNYPHSVALACEFVACLMEADGKVQQDGFWQHFSQALIKRSELLRPQGDFTALQQFCQQLATGDASAAVTAAAQQANVWSHALIVAQLMSLDLYDRMLLQIHKALTQNQQVGSVAGTLTANEAKDPLVQALLLVYSAIARGGVPEFPEDTVALWPAFVAMASVLIRKSDYGGLFPGFLDALAGTLAAKGDIFGAHVCYLLSGERSLEAVDAPSSYVSLIGVEHRNPQNFGCLLEPLSLQLTEAFEYALRCGDPEALCPSIQPFKLTHAMLLADMGFTEKARRYMALLQFFVKAVPQKRLSDAFRSSMRSFNEALRPNDMPSPTSAASAPSAFAAGVDAPRVSQMVSNFWGSSKGLIRGLAENTGLKPKPTPAPALTGNEDEIDTSPSALYAGLPDVSGS